MLRLELAAVYVGVNIIILLVLAVMVALGRQRHKIVLGEGDNLAFTRVVRAHGNAAEYIPAALVGLVLLALFPEATPIWLLHAAGLSLTIGRLTHAIGLYAGALNLGRVAGIALTWLSYLLIGGGLIYAGFAQQL